jgi:hypothetical protein
MTSNLDLIRQKCIEANPEIRTSRFRCLCAENGRCSYKDHNRVGREVRLADVLLAMNKKLNDEASGAVIIAGDDGTFGIVYTDRPGYEKYVNWQSEEWNLREDDLTKQSEETISFLYDLLK